MARVTIQEFNTYPMRSARGIPQSQIRVVTTGLEWDRHWMVVRENGTFLTQRLSCTRNHRDRNHR